MLRYVTNTRSGVRLLDAPIARVSAVDAPQAYSKSLEAIQLPGKEKFLGLHLAYL